MTTIDRRAFLRRLAAGGALVTAPAFLAGCGVRPALELAETPPANPFLDWFGLGERELARVLAELGGGGGEFGEAYFQHTRGRRLRRVDGAPESADATIEQGAGLRVVRHGRTTFAHTENLELDALRAAARQAASLDAAPPVATGAFVAAPRADRYAVAAPWSDVSDAARTRLFERVEAAVRAADPGVTRVVVDWRDRDERILVASLDGRLVDDRRPLASLALQVSIRRGDETQSGFASRSLRDGPGGFADEVLDELAATAVRRAQTRFEARRPPAGELPVVLAAGVAGVLLQEAVGHALEGDFVASGESVYARSVGETVASDAVTLVDDATLPHARGALNVDDEGTATGRTPLVERGVLRGFLHDRRSADRAGVATTGSARRESFRHAPLPRMSCTLLADGTTAAAELEGGLELGIVAETVTAGRADPGGGAFSFTVRNGWLVEKGRRTQPIRDVTLSGTGSGLLAGLVRVGDDGRLDPGGWTCGKHGQRVPVSPGSPSVLVEGLTVSPPAANA